MIPRLLASFLPGAPRPVASPSSDLVAAPLSTSRERTVLLPFSPLDTGGCPLSRWFRPTFTTPDQLPLLDPETMTKEEITDLLLRRSAWWNLNFLGRMRERGWTYYRESAPLEKLATIAHFRGMSLAEFLRQANLSSPYLGHLQNSEIEGARPDPRFADLLRLVRQEILPLPREERIRFARDFLEAALHTCPDTAFYLTAIDLLLDSLFMTWRELVCYHQETRCRLEEDLLRFISLRNGPVPFDQFFDYAMFRSPHSLYSGETGRRLIGSGRFFTTASCWKAQGQVLVYLALNTWRRLGKPPLFEIVEMGAGNGTLAESILQKAEELAQSEGEDWRGFVQALRYHTVDRSPVLARIQQETLARFGARAVIHEASAFSPGLPFIENGLFLSNELVDMFPPIKIRNKNGILYEVYVTSHGGLLQEVLGPLRPETRRFLKDHPVTVDRGEVFYLQPGIDRWIRSMNHHLGRGYILTIDYGRLRTDLLKHYSEYDACLLRGSLTSDSPFYHRMKKFLRVQTYELTTTGFGEPKDISVGVDFTTILEAGRRVGCLEVLFTTQRSLILDLMAVNGIHPGGDGEEFRDGIEGITYARDGDQGFGNHRALLLGKGVDPALPWDRPSHWADLRRG